MDAEAEEKSQERTDGSGIRQRHPPRCFRYLMPRVECRWLMYGAVYSARQSAVTCSMDPDLGTHYMIELMNCPHRENMTR